jgi:hypothetical protein
LPIGVTTSIVLIEVAILMPNCTLTCPLVKVLSLIN